MKKHISHLIYGWLALMGLLSSCGEDRSGEYYALIATKTWIYEAGRGEAGFLQEAR